MKNYQKSFAILGLTLLISGSLSISAEACPGRFSPIRLIKRAFSAIGDGVSMGVSEVKSTFHAARSERSSDYGDSYNSNEYDSYGHTNTYKASCGR